MGSSGQIEGSQMLSKASNLPRHVAIIMDGNGRWAQQRGLPRLRGHQAGVTNIRHVVEIFAEYSMEYITVFAFSTENWDRPQNEVSRILRIFEETIDPNVELLHENNVRICYMGRLQKLPLKLQEKVKKALELTRNNTKITLSIAFDYGARAEILDAVHSLLADNVSSGEIDEISFRKHLYLPEIPDPDLIIRTGGQRRLSNFLIWQAIYSELYFTDVLWPDFDRTKIEQALTYYASRQRHFGKR
ncbi:polyprenyl diphosphate synthase [Chloroflexota bacterium]